MKHDLKSMTRRELEKLSANIDKALARRTDAEKKAAIAAAEKAVKAHGFTLADITEIAPPAKRGRKAAKKPKAPSAPKYADPADKSKTWTGKGRQPDWFKAAMAAGKSPEDMAI
jgi:DNA-binding protein H-NS